MRIFLLFVTLIIINPVLHAEEKKAYFAGGCFWCMEESFDQVEGVISTISGYSGGHLKNPKYADVIYTDVWVSMGCEEESQGRLESMTPYQVNDGLFALTKDNCLFMHCMPAHPGEEVTQSVLNSERAILFDQAENRLHMQKAILAKLSNIKP